MVARSSIVMALIGCKQPWVDSDLYQGKRFSMTVIEMDDYTTFSLKINTLPPGNSSSLST
jgi:hypothetical protein